LAFTLFLSHPAMPNGRRSICEIALEISLKSQRFEKGRFWAP